MRLGPMIMPAISSSITGGSFKKANVSENIFADNKISTRFK
jgi:hypothetical protein